MRDFPIEHRGQAIRTDHDVAHPKIAMNQRRRRRFGQVVLAPSERKRDDRAIAAIGFEALSEVGECDRGIHHGNLRHPVSR